MAQKDQELLTRLRESDRDAFRDLFTKYHQSLFNFIVYRVKDEAIADDIVQDTFLRVWKHKTSLKPKESFFSYIAKISNNLCLDFFRHENVKIRHKDTIPEPTPSQLDNPAVRHDKESLESEIQNVVNEHLPDKCREIFILSRVNGLVNQDIADTLGLSRRTVENQLYRALKILRVKLKDYL
ncbi:MAG: RNA polymerase sigma factor [Candidatus Neomarinimicrobiota bacterium]